MKASLRSNGSTPGLSHPLHRQGQLPLHDLLSNICDKTLNRPCRRGLPPRM